MKLELIDNPLWYEITRSQTPTLSTWVERVETVLLLICFIIKYWYTHWYSNTKTGMLSHQILIHSLIFPHQFHQLSHQVSIHPSIFPSAATGRDSALSLTNVHFQHQITPPILGQFNCQMAYFMALNKLIIIIYLSTKWSQCEYEYLIKVSSCMLYNSSRINSVPEPCLRRVVGLIGWRA